jgi:hypothetical protein
MGADEAVEPASRLERRSVMLTFAANSPGVAVNARDQYYTDERSDSRLDSTF